MIYTFTPNPALDISGLVDKIVPDEKTYVSDEIRSPGGNGINAARIAHRLGAEVLASGLLGGMSGEEIKSMLDKEHVKHNFIPIAGNTRFNLTVSSKKTNRQTRLSFPGPEIKGSELKKFLDYIDDLSPEHIIVIGGSLPQGLKPLHIAKIIRSLSKKNALCMVDMPGPILSETVASRPFFIKPNLTEFQELLGKKVETIDRILPKARELNALIPLICISSVEGGAILVTKKRAWYGRTPKIKIQSTVGAGDSMVGSITTCLWKNKLQFMNEGAREEFLNDRGGEILRMGLAAACATLAQPGMIMGQKKDILGYLEPVLIKEI